MKVSFFNNIFSFVSLSLGLHLLLAAAISINLPDVLKRKSKDLEIIMIENPPVVVEEVFVPKVALEPSQIIETDTTDSNNEKPTDTKFLSEKNKKFLKETTVRKKGEFKNSFVPQTFDRPAKNSNIDGFLFKEIAENSSNENPSQSLDYIQELDEGTETLLNANEFIYFSYYARIRKQLNLHWESKVKRKISKMKAEGRFIASKGDKSTKLLITLDSQGRILKIQVIGTTGIREFDEAGVEAFKAAGPFLDPPEGIIDPDGEIKIRWDLILESNYRLKSGIAFFV